ncbi:hypothetical protein, partial [Cupriavidus numazuensis]|uniref:hypothetical protein n=1 Tax=Cupriavidus numazuensis TaxID=221992 RepID=UPI001BAA86C3
RIHYQAPTLIGCLIVKEATLSGYATGFAVCVAASAAEKQDFKVFSTINQAFSRNFFFLNRALV